MNSSAVIAQELKYQSALAVLSTLQLTFWPLQATVFSKFNESNNASNVLSDLTCSSVHQSPTDIAADESKYDYIVVGAGPTGCVIANRLTEDKNVNVLLIEAGGDPHYETLLQGFLAELPKSEMDYNYTAEYSSTVKQCHRNGKPHLYTGRVLGGTSSISVLVYERGNPKDFKKWAKASNDTTWLWQNVIPYYKKAEKLRWLRSDKLDTVKYGTNGPVSLTKDQHKQVNKYLRAFKEAGNDVVADLNANTFVGYTAALLASDVYKQTAAYSYLRKAKNRPNLHVRKHTLVTRILIGKNKTAYGVEAMLKNNDVIRLYATRKVIVCAGVIKSPQLLMISGIGPKKELQSNNIKVIVDLPVGQNLQVQPGVVVEHKTEKFKEPPLLFNPLDTGAGFIIGMSALNKKKKCPDYQTISFVQLNPKRMLKYCAFYYDYCGRICDKFYEATRFTESLYSIIVVLNSTSRGSVQLHSTNAVEQPTIKFNLYSDESDLEKLIDYIMDYLKIEQSSYFKKIGATLIDATPNCGSYEPDSRDYWRCYVMCMTTTVGRYTGTCAMGAVVDSRLRVYGVKNLHVADASVMPFTPSGGLYAPAVMIGEKLSDMIKKDASN